MSNKGNIMEEKGKTIKQYCKDAMKRLKSGFWENYYASLDEKLKIAEQNGVSTTKVKDYYVERVVNTITKSKNENEVFYLKVKSMLDSEGEVANAIGRLTDHKVYDSLSYEEKQRYTLELSEKYVKAVERYNKEKSLGC